VTRVSVCTRRREIVRPRRRLAWVPGSSTLPLAYRSVCHRRCKCSVDFCAACYRSRWLLGNSGCLKRQTPSVDTCRCVPNPEHPRFHLPIGISVACTFCARVFLVAGIDSLAAFAVDPCGRDLGGRPPGSKRCLSPVAFPTRCLESLGGVHGCSRAVYYGRGRTTCSIRYPPPGIRRVFPWSRRSVGSFDGVGGSVPVCATCRLAARSNRRLRVGCNGPYLTPP